MDMMSLHRLTFSTLVLCSTVLLFGGSAFAAVSGAESDGQGKKISRAIASKAPKEQGYPKSYIGQMQTYYAEYEDTLVHVGRRFGLGFVEMRAANPNLDPWIPGSGAKIIVPTMHLLPDSAPRDSIVINLAEMRMYIYGKKGAEPITYPIGIGRDGLETPVGTTRIMRKMANPTWYPTERMRREDPKLPAFVPPGPENPMGTHALYLGIPMLAVHGTNKPYGIGRRVSSGCIRMFPEDITKVFDMTPISTKVTIVDQPIKAAWIEDRLYLEVHPTQEQATQMERDGAIPDYQLSERDLSYILRVAGPQVEKLDWAAIRKVVKERRGYPVVIASKSRQRAMSDSSIENGAVESPTQTASATMEPVQVEAEKSLVEPVRDFAPKQPVAKEPVKASKPKAASEPVKKNRMVNN